MAELKPWLGLSLGSAGQRTLVSLLATSDVTVRVSKLMQQQGLVSRQRPPHQYAKSEQEHLCRANGLGRKCKPEQPNQAWCGDVIYIWTRSGCLSLAVFIDLFARRVVAFATAKSPDSELTKTALTMAYKSQEKTQGTVIPQCSGWPLHQQKRSPATRVLWSAPEP